MGEWRFYAQRASSGLVLDTDVQLGETNLDWSLSAPCGGDAYLPSGMATNPVAEDGRLFWSKWDTILLGEEDGELAWAGICVAANPDEKGRKLEFIGPRGWLERVPYNSTLLTWRANAFDVARELINHSKKYPNSIPFALGNNKSAFTVGDIEPPAKPKPPPRRKGEKKSEWQNSKRYQNYRDALTDWNDLYGQRKRYEVVWWEAPYIGEEFDSLAKEVGFDYRETFRWKNRNTLVPEFGIQLGDRIATRRTDIELVDGVNLAKPLDTKDSDDPYANAIFGLGAGEGKSMIRAEATVNDSRLYQAEFIAYKSVRDKARLRSLVQADLKNYSNIDPDIDTVVAWDMPGYASLASLRCGDEVRVMSDNATPVVDTWRRVASISRNPVQSVVTIGLENAV